MIRPAEITDQAAWLRIRNDPEALFWSGQRQPISEETHARWFTRTLTSPREHLTVIEESNNLYGIKPQPGRVVGYSRIQEVGVVSLALEPGMRGHGLGTMLLLDAENTARQAKLRGLLAVIHPGNTGSLRAFMRAGYAVHPVNESVVFLTL